MAWSISISQEGWQEIREALEKWSRDDLIAAIADDFYEYVEKWELMSHSLANRLMQNVVDNLSWCADDVLVDAALELIEINDTCDNGGFSYWIDLKGYHKVRLSDDWTEE